MAENKCNCGETHEGSCAACAVDDIFSFWCESCQRSVADKRCPYCGLKTKRKKS